MFSVGSEAAPSLARIASPVFPQMVRLQFPGPDSLHYQRLTVWDLLDRLNSDDLNPGGFSFSESGFLLVRSGTRALTLVLGFEIETFAEDLSVYEFKVDGIPRPLTCPYCNEPHDLGSLCSHLGQKHLFESRPAVSTVHSNLFLTRV